MTYSVEYDPQAIGDLKKIPKPQRKRIVTKIDWLAANFENVQPFRYPLISQASTNFASVTIASSTKSIAPFGLLPSIVSAIAATYTANRPIVHRGRSPHNPKSGRACNCPQATTNATSNRDRTAQKDNPPTLD